MKFNITQQEIYKSLQLISGAVSTHPNMTILSNLLLEIRSGILYMTATDTEIELKASISLEGEYEEGSITVPARKFLDICRSLSANSMIDFSVEDTHVLLKVERNKYLLTSLPASEYPNVNEWDALVQIELQQGVLQKLIECCQFSMAQQDVRYYLNGMYFETNGALLRTVATDGHRLSISTYNDAKNSFESQGIILPRKGVMELSRLLVDADANITLLIGKSNIKALVGHYTFTSKLIDGAFPDYKRVIPSQANQKLVADREALKQSLSRAGILSNEKFRGVRFNIEKNLLRITANNPQQEKAEELLDVEYAGTELEIGFNVNYLIDVMNNIKTDKVCLSFTNANTSVLIESINDDNSAIDSIYIVMPTRL